MLRALRAATTLMKKLCVAILPIFNGISAARSRCSMTEASPLTTHLHTYVSRNLRLSAAQTRKPPGCWKGLRRCVPQSDGRTVPRNESWPLQKKLMANSPRQRANASECIVLPNLTMQPTLCEHG